MIEGNCDGSTASILVSGIPYLSPHQGGRKDLRTAVEQYVAECLNTVTTVSTEELETERSKRLRDVNNGDPKEQARRCRFNVNTSVHKRHSRLDESALVVFHSIASGKDRGKDPVVDASVVVEEDHRRRAAQTASLSFRGHQLFLSAGSGKLRDHAFASYYIPQGVPRSILRSLQLDPTAAFSVTDGRTAGRMARLLWTVSNYQKLADLRENTSVSNDWSNDKGTPNFLQLKQQLNEREELRCVRVLDGMACTGGNTLAFGRYFGDTMAKESPVTAVELNTDRSLMLTVNLTTMSPFTQTGNIRVVNTSLQSYLKSTECSSKGNVLFLDAPWGGTDYSNTMSKVDFDVVLPTVDVTGAEVPDSTPWSVGKLIVDCVQQHSFSIVAAKLPSCFDLQKHIVSPLVHGPHWELDNPSDTHLERPFPFRFHFGAHTQLVVVARNSLGQSNSSGDFALTNSRLSSLVRTVMLDWHNVIDLQGDAGCRECRPEFYDFEKKRWILLKKWIDTGKKTS